MKCYEIIDGENDRQIGVLLHYDKEGSYIVELKNDLDEWTAPLLFTAYVKKGIYTIPRDISLLWVRERTIPNSRQNINDILAHHKLRSYDEMKILEISEGRCSQDGLYIKIMERIPDYVEKRMLRNVAECMISEDRYVICFFADDSVKKIDLSELSEDGIEKILRNRDLFESCRVGTGGYSITFNDSIDIPAAVLYRSGIRVPLGLGDFTAFVQKNVLDTTQTCSLLQCTRQNLSYMVGKDQLKPVREEVKGNLYFKGDVLKRMW